MRRDSAALYGEGVETALALAMVAHGGTAADRVLDYVLSGDCGPLFDGMSIDLQFGAENGWVP
jgi:hypothetical protein